MVWRKHAGLDNEYPFSNGQKVLNRFADLVRKKEINQRFSSSIVADKTGEIIGKYRKIHLPGNADYQSRREVQHLLVSWSTLRKPSFQ